jgi:hypothetical protein
VNNEPVAWMSQSGSISKNKKDFESVGFTLIYPLYTHPAKTLTDEEIYEFTHRMIICSGQNPNAADINIYGLCRIVEDILKKTSEK